jgi:glycosyltransferase involved in cell wall biosynthesis
MRVLMLYPGTVGELPPLITAAVCMARLSSEVTMVVGRCAPETAEHLRRHSVAVAALGPGPYPLGLAGRATACARVGLLFRKTVRAWRPDVLWYHGGHAMRYAALAGGGNTVFVVAHAHEMYPEGSGLDRMQNRVCRSAGLVICPELNRRWMLQIRSRSKARFVVVPNDVLPEAQAGAPVPPGTLQVFRQHGGSPECDTFLIYQGLFSADRCLLQAIAAFRGLPSGRPGLILLGGGRDPGYTRRVRDAAAGDSRIAIVPRIEPPGHLRVTAGCAGGILLYAPTELNNVYCAPNKIFEYARAGLPMILPDYPGLAAINDAYGLGVTCNPLDPASIRQAMERVLGGAEQSRGAGAGRFLASVPPLSTLYEHVLGLLTPEGAAA